MRSFFRGKNALVKAGIEALLNLITHNQSVWLCSQANLFDHICKREGENKKIFLYQQHRFSKLGKATLSILEAKLLLLYDEEDTTNQLVEACKLYISNELFIIELQCLAYFNHFVTYPNLDSVERCSQTELRNLLPRLYHDLKKNKP